MKIRKCFVSNSSSSSYVCDVCGEEVGGWDMCLSDADMCQCVNQHTFCTGHGGEELDELMEKDEDGEVRYEVPAENCPCCSFKAVADTDLIRYLLKEVNGTRESVTKKMKDSFSNYNDFEKHVAE
jgi:hypothetical protein